jgi:ATP-binding cassette subfamily F protein uup
LYFGSEITSSYVVQTERFEWLFSDFGVSLPTFDFILGYDDIATSFSSNYASIFIKNYSYLTNDEVMSSSMKNSSYLVNEKFEFEQLQHVIATLETEKVQLSEQLSSGAGTHAEIAKWSERIGQIVEELNEKELRWLMLSELPD